MISISVERTSNWFLNEVETIHRTGKMAMRHATMQDGVRGDALPERLSSSGHVLRAEDPLVDGHEEEQERQDDHRVGRRLGVLARP